MTGKKTDSKAGEDHAKLMEARILLMCVDRPLVFARQSLPPKKYLAIERKIRKAEDALHEAMNDLVELLAWREEGSE